MIDCNNLLSDAYQLDNTIKIYIPSTLEGNKKTSNQKYVKEAMELFSGLFGGVTITKAKGGWLSDEHGLITEDVVLVESFASDDVIVKGVKSARDFALSIKDRMSQEAVSLEVNGVLSLI